MQFTELEQEWINYIESYNDESLKKTYLTSASHMVFKLLKDAKKKSFDDFRLIIDAVTKKIPHLENCRKLLLQELLRFEKRPLSTFSEKKKEHN